MAELNATKLVQEMSGEITLRDFSDTKKYFPPWLTKHDLQRVCIEMWL